MASEALIEFTDANFDTEVLGSDMPVLVDFWAEWCQPCIIQTPTIEALAEEFEGKVKIGSMDVDSHRNAAVQLGISAIPTVILFKDGQVVKKFVGLTPKDHFANALNEVI